MSRQHRHERRHRDDIEDRYHEEDEDRRYRSRRDDDQGYRHNHGYRDYDEVRYGRDCDEYCTTATKLRHWENVATDYICNRHGTIDYDEIPK